MEGISKDMQEFDEKHGEVEDVRDLSEEDSPITVKSVQVRKSSTNGLHETGSYVAIRPVKDEKTYVGILLGDMLTAPDVRHSKKSGTLFVDFVSNPAIWVPDLGRVVWGYESWWGTIASEKDLKRITDQDIENVWYVKALKSLEEGDDS
jgi:hypothetical protein